MKKTIYIIFSVLLVIVIGLLAYFGYRYFTGAEDEEIPILPPDTRTTVSSEGEPMIDIKKLTQITEEAVAAYWIENRTGKLFTMQPSGIITGINEQPINDLHETKVSSDNQKLLVHFGYPNKQVFSVLNVLSKSWSPLPNGTIAAAWHPENSSEIAYLQNNYLRIMDIDSGKSRTIMPINLIDVTLDWPVANGVLIADRPSALTSGSVLAVELSTKNAQINANGKGLIVKKSGALELQFTNENGRNSRLSLINTATGAEILNFNDVFLGDTTTLPSKCAIDKTKIYCAVPRSIPDGVILPDDYLKRQFLSSDDIYLTNLDIENQLIETTIIYSDLEKEIDAKDLRVIGNSLYFINKRDSKLYKLDI